jgi:hypothetical protein
MHQRTLELYWLTSVLTHQQYTNKKVHSANFTRHQDSRWTWRHWLGLEITTRRYDGLGPIPTLSQCRQTHPDASGAEGGREG